LKEDVLDGVGGCAALLHGAHVELKVAGGLALEEVRLMGENERVDEAAGFGIAARKPGDVDAGESGLKRFQERHGLPYGEDLRMQQEWRSSRV
jgi:hypothetical protein